MQDWGRCWGVKLKENMLCYSNYTTGIIMLLIYSENIIFNRGHCQASVTTVDSSSLLIRLTCNLSIVRSLTCEQFRNYVNVAGNHHFHHAS